MQTLPTRMLHLLKPFASLFSERVWSHAQVLLAGTILTPGKRTVAAALRVMGSETSDASTGTIGCSAKLHGRVEKRVASYLGC
jgi:hypothetical protein